MRCRRPIIFGGGLQVPRRCVQQCNTLQQFSNSPKGVQDKFEDGLMKAQNCPKLSANRAGTVCQPLYAGILGVFWVGEEIGLHTGVQWL